MPQPKPAPPTNTRSTAFFGRLADALPSAALGAIRRAERLGDCGDGLYLHKRPLRMALGDAASPLASLGTVFHHAVLYELRGGRLRSADFAPASGADITSNIFEAAPARAALAEHAAVPPEDDAPFLFLGGLRGLDDGGVRRAVGWMQARPYHAVTNNCLHFADALLRVLSDGAVQGACLLYDALCGAPPAAESPILLLMQLMLGRSWADAVDGSALAATAAATAGEA